MKQMYIYSVNTFSLTHEDKRLNMNCVCLHLDRKFYYNKLWSISSVCYCNIVFFPLPLIFLVSCSQLRRSGQKEDHATPTLRIGRVCSDRAERGCRFSSHGCTVGIRDPSSPPHFPSALLCFMHSFYGWLEDFLVKIKLRNTGAQALPAPLQMWVVWRVVMGEGGSFPLLPACLYFHELNYSLGASLRAHIPVRFLKFPIFWLSNTFKREKS